MFIACVGIWCLPDISSISPSSEQTEGLWGNQCLRAALGNSRLSPEILTKSNLSNFVR